MYKLALSCSVSALLWSGESKKTGALFVAVFRGKVSEGMDFADNYARAVITVREVTPYQLRFVLHQGSFFYFWISCLYNRKFHVSLLISESQEDFVGVLLSWFFFMHVGWNPLSQFKGCSGRHITQKDKCTKLSNTFIDNYCPKKTTDPFSLTTELLYEGEIKNVEVEYDDILLIKLTTIYYLSSKMCPNAFFVPLRNQCCRLYL